MQQWHKYDISLLCATINKIKIIKTLNKPALAAMYGPHSLFSAWTNQVNQPYGIDEGYRCHVRFAELQEPMKNREKQMFGELINNYMFPQNR